MTEAIDMLICLAAAGKITRRDWQVIDAVHVQRLGVRAAARHIGISHVEVLRRMNRVRRLAR